MNFNTNNAITTLDKTLDKLKKIKSQVFNYDTIDNVLSVHDDEDYVGDNLRNNLIMLTMLIENTICDIDKIQKKANCL